MLRKSLAICLLGLLTLTLGACSSSTRVIEVTRFSPDAKEVTRVVETIIEVEVTRIIERTVIATPTPLPPTATPSVPEPGSVDNPYPVGTPGKIARGDIEFELTVLELIKGEKAEKRVLNASKNHNPAPPGTEYVLAKIGVSYPGPDQGILNLPTKTLYVASNKRVYGIDDAPEFANELPDLFDFTLLPGGTAEGWFAMAVPPDPEMTLAISNTFFALPDGEFTAEESEDKSSDAAETVTLDPESLIGAWIAEDDNSQIRYEFLTDGTYVIESTFTPALPDSQPETVTEEGVWEYQEGSTVCLTPTDGEATCSEWFVVDDTLRLGDSDVIVGTREG